MTRLEYLLQTLDYSNFDCIFGSDVYRYSTVPRKTLKQPFMQSASTLEVRDDTLVWDSRTGMKLDLL